jgi:hypothetical protein
MAKRKQNPKSRSLYRKWIVEDKFNPASPSEAIVNELYEWKLPNSNYIKKEYRDARIGSLNSEVSSYVAFEAVMGSPEIRLLCAMQYYIHFARDEEETKQTVYEEITNLNECGIIAEINAKHLKEEWGIK